jgi:SAM-dependent methyltransferase
VKSAPEKDARRLYGDLAWTWPIISPVDDYQEEGELFARVIREESQIPVKTLLDLGCGGGHVDHYLKNHFQVTSADISQSMLKLARQLNPEVEYMMGDMRMLRLDRTFDAVVIHDAINYMLTPQDLRAAFQTAHQHLKSGGVFLTCVEVMPDSFEQNKTRVTTRKKDGVEIAFIENYYDPDENDTVYQGTFIYLIRQGGRLSIETDRHLCGVFPLASWRRLLGEIGFEVRERRFEHSEFAPGQFYPLLVCIKK